MCLYIEYNAEYYDSEFRSAVALSVVHLLTGTYLKAKQFNIYQNNQDQHK